MPSALIALGGNLGDVQETFLHAVEFIRELDSVGNVTLSPLYRTTPVGEQAGDPFLNAVLSCDTNLAPADLLLHLQQIENRLGRVRTVHWGPRTLDLDLLAIGQFVINSAQLTLPHPLLWIRRFVLDPLCDVAPDWRHPRFQMTASDLRTLLRSRPLPVMLLGPVSQIARDIQVQLGEEVTISTGYEKVIEQSLLVLGHQRPSHFQVKLTGESLWDQGNVVQQLLRGALDNPARC